MDSNFNNDNCGNPADIKITKCTAHIFKFLHCLCIYSYIIDNKHIAVQNNRKQTYDKDILYLYNGNILYFIFYNQLSIIEATKI